MIIYITVAVLLLFLVSQSPKNPKQHRHRNRSRRLKLRSNFTFASPTLNSHHGHHIPFDPVVADLEMKREDREWEKMYVESHHPELIQNHTNVHHGDGAPGEESQPEWEDFMNDEDYLNDEDKFNITDRLVLLFPKVDVNPADGFVTEAELTHWNLEQSQREILHRTQREMEVHDKNKDGFVSFSEYEPPSWVKQSDNNGVGSDMGWWKEEHFNASDADGDGLLNLTEYNDFLHPADTKNPKLLNWLCKEEIRERDTDKDGKVNFKEFFHGLFDMVRNYDEENHSSNDHSHGSEESPARKLFAELDKDGDGLLSDAEILPIIGKLHPSEHYYAKQQSEYIIQQADSDKDGRLTLTEMIDNPYVFYSAIFNDDEDYEYHDEFR